MAGRHNFSGHQSPLDTHRNLIDQQIRRAYELRDEAEALLTDPDILMGLARRYNSFAEAIEAYSKAIADWKSKNVITHE